MSTKTAVIVLSGEAILIWAIPPLSPQPPDFFDHNPTHIPPLFTIPFPDDISSYPKRIRWNTMSSWYFGSSHPLYFDMLCQDSKLQMFQIMLKPDLSTASLRVINTSELTGYETYDFDDEFFMDYMICDDALVSCWFHDYQDLPLDEYRWGVYTRLTSARLVNAISHGRPAAKILLPEIGHENRLYFCPASGRFVFLIRDGSNSVVVYDFF